MEVKHKFKKKEKWIIPFAELFFHFIFIALFFWLCNFLISEDILLNLISSLYSKYFLEMMVVALLVCFSMTGFLYSLSIIEKKIRIGDIDVATLILKYGIDYIYIIFINTTVMLFYIVFFEEFEIHILFYSLLYLIVSYILRVINFCFSSKDFEFPSNYNQTEKKDL